LKAKGVKVVPLIKQTLLTLPLDGHDLTTGVMMGHV